MKKLILLFVLLLSSPCFSADPVICFTDLIDGPKTGWNGSAAKGCAVTVWGRNFGTERGANYVTVCSTALTNASDYAEWGVTENNAVGLERITFWTNSSCATGAGEIKVTVGGVDTSTAPFYARETGNIYFVDKTNGDNGYNGEYDSFQSESIGPFETLSYAKQQLSGGEIVYVRSGTYITEDQYGSVLFIGPTRGGSVNNHTAFVGYPAEIPVINTITNSLASCVRNSYDGAGYIVLAKFKFFPYSAGVRYNYSYTGYYRMVGIEIDGQGIYPAFQSQIGAIGTDCISDVDILGCSVYGWGYNKFDHGIYVGSFSSTQNTDNYDIGWNEFYDLGTDVSGIYIHPKDSDSTTPQKFADEIDIHDNICYSLEHAGIHLNSRVEDIRLYNNIVYDCGSSLGRGAISFTVSNDTVSDILVYNNTVYSAANSSVLIVGAYSNVTMKNNIIYSLSNTSYISTTITSSSDYDLWFGTTTTPAWATNAVESDPDFVSQNNANFHLLDGSPAINTGTDTVSGVVTLDFEGLDRADGGFSIGVYESSGTASGEENPRDAFQGSFMAW